MNNVILVRYGEIFLKGKNRKFFEDTFEQHFANQEARNLYFVASTPKEAIEYIKNYVPLEITEKYVYK